MIVKYFCTEGKRDTMPGNVGGIFFGVELNFHNTELCYLHSFVNQKVACHAGMSNPHSMWGSSLGRERLNRQIVYQPRLAHLCRRQEPRWPAVKMLQFFQGLGIRQCDIIHPRKTSGKNIGLGRS